MKIERLRLDGLTRFQAPIDLDFSGLPAGLIAVTGENGAGKTTLLEAMFAGFYGTMPSRADKPLFDLTGGRRDAFIEVDASFDAGGRYRARTNLDGVARKRDAVLEHLTAAGTTRVNDGKAKTFDAAIAARFPSPDTLLASAFAAQNRKGSFATLSTKDRKDLFSSMLGLDQLERYAATARQAAGLLERRRAELRAKVDVLLSWTSATEAETLRADADALQGDAARLALEQTDVEAALARAQDRLTRAIAEDESSRAARDEHQVLAARRDELVRQQQHLSGRRAAIERRRRMGKDEIEQRRMLAREHHAAAVRAIPSDERLDRDLRERLQQIDADARAEREDLETRVANNRALLSDRAAVDARLADLVRLEAEAEAAQAAYHEADLRATACARASLEATRAAEAQAGFASDLRRAQEDAALLTRVPFGDGCAAAGCQFVQQAIAARTKIPVYEAGVARHQAACAVAETAAAAGTDAMAQRSQAWQRVLDLAEALKSMKGAREQAERLRTAEDRVRDLEGRLRALLEQADAQRDVARQHRATRAADGLEHRSIADAAWQQAQDQAAQETDALQAAVDQDLAELDAQDAQIRRDLAQTDARLTVTAAAASAADVAAAERSAADTALGRVRAAAATVASALAVLAARREALDRRRALFDARSEERRAIERDITQLETDLVEWQALATVFSRDGLPVLEIDAAGPGVSAVANDLLQACFGGRFTVELVTQETKADGKGLKESFEIKVWDAERGNEPRDLAHLSGGEQVIVDEALKSAIAAFINTRNALPVRTIWRDETIGALDGENATRYVAMLRRLRERCGARHLFFISHNPDASALADVQLHIEDGTARFLYPPFPSEAA